MLIISKLQNQHPILHPKSKIGGYFFDSYSLIKIYISVKIYNVLLPMRNQSASTQPRSTSDGWMLNRPAFAPIHLP